MAEAVRERPKTKKKKKKPKEVHDYTEGIAMFFYFIALVIGKNKYFMKLQS